MASIFSKFNVFETKPRNGIGNSLGVLPSLFLFACGGGDKKNGQKPFDGLISSYIPPKSDFTKPTENDQNFKILLEPAPDPYWVNSLLMDDWENQIVKDVQDNESFIYFSFPKIEPTYITYPVVNWGPANTDLLEAGRETFILLNQVLETKFVEIETSNGNNIISIAQSSQTGTSGFSYFPNNFFELGSDVFISYSYSNPDFISDTLTNYDYEVLVHELGHSLGLKHPFESDQTNEAVLSSAEDNTEHTVMSYTDLPNTFSGTYRSLDWMALTKIYGVNDTFNNGDNEYFFSSKIGQFIIDGAGIDTINASKEEAPVTIDLRPGGHSFIENRAEYITHPNQLTISNDTFIENVYSGPHSDKIIANGSNNTILTGLGDDEIFLGEGKDTVASGAGFDTIDCSEEQQAQDTIIFESTHSLTGFDTIFGFKQGENGDYLVIEDYVDTSVTLLPVLLLSDIPLGYISNHILRIVGEEMDSASNVINSFQQIQALSKLNFVEDKGILLLTAKTKNTGEDQNLFLVTKYDNTYEANTIAKFIGNYLDIDLWSSSNFSNTNLDFVA